MKLIKISTMLIIILIIVSGSLFSEYAEPHSCTIFTAVQGETILFGDNLDYHEGDLIIGFFPPSTMEFGSVHFGYQKGEKQSYQRAVNDQGLAWAVNSIPRSKLNPQPGKIYDYIDDEFLYTITKKAATVEEALQIAQKYDFGEAMIVQIHIADANSDAVVIGPGADGEIAFTRKSAGDGFLLSTNFNLASQKGPVDFRWDTATSLLETLDTDQVLTPEFAGDILEAVHLNALTTYTLFSNIIDLKHGEIYIYYMSQYDEVAKINIVDELAKGQRIVAARNLFSEETALSGDAAYRKFEIRFASVVVAAIMSILAIIGGGLVFFSKKRIHSRGKK